MIVQAKLGEHSLLDHHPCLCTRRHQDFQCEEITIDSFLPLCSAAAAVSSSIRLFITFVISCRKAQTIKDLLPGNLHYSKRHCKTELQDCCDSEHKSAFRWVFVAEILTPCSF